MATMTQIEDLARWIGREFDADKVVLFGSYARGVPTGDSDVDVLVILPFEGRSVNQSVQMRMRLRPAFPVDLLVRAPQNVRRRLGRIRGVLGKPGDLFGQLSNLPFQRRDAFVALTELTLQLGDPSPVPSLAGRFHRPLLLRVSM